MMIVSEVTGCGGEGEVEVVVKPGLTWLLVLMVRWAWKGNMGQGIIFGLGRWHGLIKTKGSFVL